MQPEDDPLSFHENCLEGTRVCASSADDRICLALSSEVLVTLSILILLMRFLFWAVIPHLQSLCKYLLSVSIQALVPILPAN